MSMGCTNRQGCRRSLYECTLFEHSLHYLQQRVLGCAKSCPLQRVWCCFLGTSIAGLFILCGRSLWSLSVLRSQGLWCSESLCCWSQTVPLIWLHKRAQDSGCLSASERLQVGVCKILNTVSLCEHAWAIVRLSSCDSLSKLVCWILVNNIIVPDFGDSLSVPHEFN